MTDKSNTEMLLPQAGIPGYIPQPKKNASEDVIGEYKKQVQQLGDKGLKEDKTGLSAKLTYIVALAWAFFQMSTASWLLLDSLYVKAFHLAFALALIYLNLPTLKSSLGPQNSTGNETRDDRRLDDRHRRRYRRFIHCD